MFTSIDFANKTELRKAVKAGTPVVLYCPVLDTTVFNGKARVTGPWHLRTCDTATPADVEQALQSDKAALDKIEERASYKNLASQRAHAPKTLRQKVLRQWKADVTVRNMVVVAVH